MIEGGIEVSDERVYPSGACSVKVCSRIVCCVLCGCTRVMCIVVIHHDVYSWRPPPFYRVRCRALRCPIVPGSLSCSVLRLVSRFAFQGADGAADGSRDEGGGGAGDRGGELERMASTGSMTGSLGATASMGSMGQASFRDLLHTSSGRTSNSSMNGSVIDDDPSSLIPGGLGDPPAGLGVPCVPFHSNLVTSKMPQSLIRKR